MNDEQRIGLIAKLVPQSMGESLWELPNPILLPNDELCTQIATFRYLDLGRRAVNLFSLFFSTGPAPAETCDYEIHYNVTAQGEILFLDIPMIQRRGEMAIKESCVYSPGMQAAYVYEAKKQDADELLIAATSGRRMPIPQGHALKRQIEAQISRF